MITLYETVTEKIIAALEQGVIPWRKPWDAEAALPVNAQSNRPYRGINVFLLALQPFADHRWLTFNQVKERGGVVKKGERSTMVVFWKFPNAVKATSREGSEIESTDEEDSPRRNTPLLRYYQVFNAEQCEGLELPELHRPRYGHHPEGYSQADLLIQGMPNPPRIVESGNAAWYRPSDDLVTVPPMERFPCIDDYYATLFHELGHATGAESRLKRVGVTGDIQFGSGEYGKEELVAELTSAFCCATVGLDNSFIANAASYIDGWLSILRADPKTVVIAAAQAQKAADYIRGVKYP